MKMMLLYITLLFNVSMASGLKFLLYNPDNPGASKSHVILVDKLGDLLVEAGHEVTTYMPYVNEVSFANFSRKSDLLLYKVSMKVPKFAQNTNIWLRDFEVTEIAAWMKQLGEVATGSCKIQLEDEALMQRLRDEHFDFGLVEYFDPCGVGIFHKIGLKRYSMIYSTQIHLIHARHVGIPTPTSFVPEITWTSASKMSFRQRVWNFICNVIVEPYIIGNHLGGFNEIFELMGKTVYDLMAEGGFIFINTDEFVDFPKPISHKVINIGGIGMKKLLSKPQILPPEFQRVFETAEKGVVFISFGSLAKTKDMPQKALKALFDAFREFPEINFIVKYEEKTDQIQEISKNVFLGEWLPQPAILSHNKTLAFVSHGGQNSVTEATYAGVPLIVVPLFGDQYRNAESVKERGVAEILKKQDLSSKKTIVEVFRSVIYNEGYQKTANDLAHVMLNKPMSADERFVKHCEFGAQYDIHDYLDLQGRHLNFIQYNNLDVIVFLFGFIVVTLYVLYRRAVFILTFKVDKEKEE